MPRKDADRIYESTHLNGGSNAAEDKDGVELHLDDVASRMIVLLRMDGGKNKKNEGHWVSDV